MSLFSRRVGRQVEDRISAVEHAVEDVLGAAADRAREATRRSASWAGRRERAARQSGRELRRQIERNQHAAERLASSSYQFARARPWTTIGMAAVAAGTLGWLLTKRD